MNQLTNVLIVGVGGQGVLLASELLCDVAFLSGLDVKKSEVHGMAQRGGVVSSHVRFGKKVYSPLIAAGEADLMLSFEQAEAKRWIHYVKTDGWAVINIRKLVPPVAFLKEMNYPENPVEDVRKRHEHVLAVSATEMAQALGNVRTANILLLGVVSRFVELKKENWEQAIRERVPKGTESVNLKAFHTGRSLQL
ncbi:indolepyruvate oxidoreductase subunit beta [bacterium]|nr:indolepyruvate oxidoreductase subunit beta [bacterium]